MAGGGLGNGAYWVALVTVYLERAGVSGAEAKASARLEGVATSMVAVGIIFGGIVAEFVGPRVTLWLPGFVVLAVLCVWIAVDRAARTRHAHASGSETSAPDEAVAALVPAISSTAARRDTVLITRLRVPVLRCSRSAAAASSNATTR